MRPPADIPAPLAGLLTALFIIAVTYLMTVDWTHAHRREQ